MIVNKMRTTLLYIVNIPTLLLAGFLLPFIIGSYSNFNTSLPKGLSELNMLAIESVGLVLFSVVGVLDLSVKNKLIKILGCAYLICFVMLIWSIFSTLLKE